LLGGDNFALRGVRGDTDLLNEHSQFDAVVIGSGFGGSISALRLAQSRKRVVVLERGRRYRPGDFPRDVREVDKIFWRYPENSTSRGLYELRFFSGIAAVVASGVGGGSLIYANVHIKPDAILFDDSRWPRSISLKALEPCYQRVATALKLAPVPRALALPKRDALRAAAAKLGRPIFDPDQAVSWDASPSPGREKCQLVGECEFGCNHGAKNTLDFNYLAEAEALGVELVPDTAATVIEPAANGYRVRWRNTADSSVGEISARQVVVAAGTLGTNDLLLRCRDQHRTLPNLSTRLGRGYSGNGDFLGTLQNCRNAIDPWHGPDVTSVIRYIDSPPQFIVAAPGFSRIVMAVLASLGQGDVGWLRNLTPDLWPHLGGKIVSAMEHGLLSQPLRIPQPNAGDPARMTNLFAIGRDNAGGVISLKDGSLDIDWDFAGQNPVLVERMTTALRALANALGGTYAPLPSWEIFRRTLTVHSLGGCALGDTPALGVVSPRGEVHGYPGLYIADGSVIPTAIGLHPAMTIAALAEHIAEAAAAA
jgi:cholesterol oxidase